MDLKNFLSYLLKLLFQIRKDVTVSHKFKVGKINPLVSLRLEENCRLSISNNLFQATTKPFIRFHLAICKNDLGAIAGQFLKLVNCNKDVFGEYYKGRWLINIEMEM